MKTTISLTFFIFLSHFGFSQQEFSKWYFGLQAGLDFSSSPPTALSGNPLTVAEAAGTISDVNGNLLF